jgi:hypothetical protein
MEIQSVAKTISINDSLIRTLSQKCDAVLIFKIFTLTNKVLLEDLHCTAYLASLKKRPFE